MNPTWIGIAALAGYLCGSISFARLLARLFAPDVNLDQTRLDIKNSNEKFDVAAVSATTLSMQVGPRLGFLTAVLDMLKVVIPILFFQWRYPAEKYFLVAALGAMIGHVWPVWYRFRGGRGLTAVYGAMFTIDWVGAVVTFFGGMVLGIVVVRDLLVAYTSGLWLLVVWLWFRTHDPDYVWYGIAANVIYLFSMIPDIRQYLDFKRRGLGTDIGETVQLTGMGRGMYRLAKRLKLIRNDK